MGRGRGGRYDGNCGPKFEPEFHWYMPVGFAFDTKLIGKLMNGEMGATGACAGGGGGNEYCGAMGCMVGGCEI